MNQQVILSKNEGKNSHFLVINKKCILKNNASQNIVSPDFCSSKFRTFATLFHGLIHNNSCLIISI